jgi:hypothetical protein
MRRCFTIIIITPIAMNPYALCCVKQSFAAKMALSIMPNGIENKSFTEKHLDFVVAPILRR